jgi:hypothetical protein
VGEAQVRLDQQRPGALVAGAEAARVPGGTIKVLVLERVFSLVQQTFLAKKTCKKSADLRPRQGNLLARNIFTGSNNTSLYLQHKIGWRSGEKNRPFFSTCFFQHSHYDFYGRHTDHECSS